MSPELARPRNLPARHRQWAARPRRADQCLRALPANYIAFEYPSASDPLWEDIVIGLPKPIVKDSMIDLLEAPGLGLDIDAEGARKYLMEEDREFFD